MKWNTVRQGLHDGYVDATKVAYNLVRMPDSVQVYAGSDTTYTDRVETDETRHYTYRLWATHQTLSSDTIVSNEVTVSGAHVPPYTDDFTDEAKFAEWTIVDNNGDGSTWQRQNGHLAYSYNSSNAADDYAISPAMKLKAGNLYYVSFVAINSYPTEKVALYAGSTPSAEGMTTQLIAPVDITYQPRQHSLLAAFRPEADGIYYFGIKACSEADRSTLRGGLRRGGCARVGTRQAGEPRRGSRQQGWHERHGELHSSHQDHWRRRPHGHRRCGGGARR